ncbi:chemotaxis protein CheW [Azospirillum agricola]|uniref:chemotaxis protein CheW n=1 Tax=Azospirillum agricola TaxID=1720247 RepID=UPI000A0EF10B|nr:chemotaxis protein CheW [Azospirillum agricola]SMH46611.1 CheW-like domain-containing protein [Azospirillum lipoferum]
MSGDRPSDSGHPDSETAAARSALRAMRDAFDRSFALPRQSPAAQTEEFAAIRLGAEPYALALRDLARLEAARPVVPLPGGRAGLLGVAGIGGRLVPVFGLAALLGLERMPDAPRWFALAGRDDGREEPLAFAFDRFDGHVAVAREALDEAGSAGPRPHVRQVLRRDGEPPRLVIDLPRLAAALRATAQDTRKA